MAHGLQSGHRKPQRKRSESERERKAKRTSACQNCDRNARKSQHRCRPPGRFAIGGEVANDAEPESNGQPGYQAAGRNLGCGPLCNQPTQPPGRVGDAFGEQQARRTATNIRCPGFGANTLLAAIGTRSRHCVGRLPDATRYNLSYLNSSAGCGHWFQSACGFLLGAVLGLVLRPILGPCVAQANGAAEYRLA